MNRPYREHPMNPLLMGILGDDFCNGFFDMNSANPSPRDQMDGVDQCRVCKALFTQPDEDPRCPECGRMLAPEVCITYEESKACPWGTPIREGEEAEIHDEKWVWVLVNGDDIESSEQPASEQDAAALDRLLGWLVRKGIK